MAVGHKNTMKEIIADCLSQQLSEYDLLKSMYPGQGEIILSDKHIIKEINYFLDSKSDYIPSHLDYKINLLINGLKLELFVTLPHNYPKEEPDIYVRCNQFNRRNETKLNSELYDYIKDNHIGEVCLYTAIDWMQENIHKYKVIAQDITAIDEVKMKDADKKYDKEEFARLWIYSHHIYNKRKRDEIVNKARELKLTGFSLPGKPGIICVEGYHRDCKEWWQDIKSMNWKKILIKKTETFLLSEENTFKKFSRFEEIQTSKSDLAKLMSNLGLNHVFNDLFGLCNSDSI